MMQSAGTSPAVNWANKPDAKAAIKLLPTVPDTGLVSRSEGSSPTAAGKKESAWTGQISDAVLKGAAKGSLPQASPSARIAPSRPSSVQGGSPPARAQG